MYVANRLDEGKSIYEQALARKVDGPTLHANMYGLAFLKRDQAEMGRQVAWAAGKAGAEDVALSSASDTEAYYGRNHKARDLSRRAMDSAKRKDQKESAALWQMEMVLREAELGNRVEAHKLTMEALGLTFEHDSQILGALVIARVGDSARATKMADDLAKRYPEDTFINNYWLSIIRSTIEMNRNNPDKTIEILEGIIPYDACSPNTTPSQGVTLYSIYVRGQAYLKIRQGREAAAEFLKIIDLRNLNVNFITGALAHLGVSRSYALQGDSQKARAAYEDFLGLWKDADPDIPILREAKAEYAKLQ